MQELCLEPTAPLAYPNRTLREFGRRRFVRTTTSAAAGRATHKWKTFRHLCLAKGEFGVSDRTLAVLEAVLTFHPDTLLTVGADDLVVFPSNRQLSTRARGMAASTLRRHIAALVDRGLLLRRDSPNGKRFARRNAQGEIDEAFGFDLSPFVARAEEFEQAAENVEVRRRRLAGLKAKVTIARRDIAKMIGAGVEASASFNWAALHRRLQSIAVPSRRALDPKALELALVELTQLEAECSTVLEAILAKEEFLPPHRASDSRLTAIASPSDLVGEEPLEHSNPGEAAAATFTIPGLQNEPTAPPSNAEGERAAVEAGTQEPTASRISRVPLALVVAACPDICDYARGGIRSFRDLSSAADLVRTLLGVTWDGWGEACGVLGREGAAIAIAAILQRGDAIKNPGGYLRTLTRRAADGRFSVWPMLMALETARRKAAAAENLHDCSAGGSRPVALRCS